MLDHTHMSVGLSPVGLFPVGLGEPAFAFNFKLGEGNESDSIIKVASLFDRALIARLQHYPDDLRVINRRRFEHLIAELFSGFGYEIELTQRTRDGGKDIIAIKHAEVDLRFLIECKRPDPGNVVGVSTVRELYGVKNDDEASKAILVTTTHFSPDAKLFSEKHRWELELKDFEAIQIWIRKYLSNE